MNHDFPTHILAKEMTDEDNWRSRLGDEKREPQKTMFSVEEYAQLLFELGFKEQKVNLRVYGHILESREGVIEWVKGHAADLFQKSLSE